MTTPADKMTFAERARVANAARQQALTPEERRESARRASAAARSATTRARQLAAVWVEADETQRAEVRRILRSAGIMR